ncbi:MAG: AsmA-like C-terminal region-containing protein, partial [Bacteroidia bacterium]|nr:AsmA-like C-terminal region-containing protein [Bacteroidia bacterium]
GSLNISSNLFDSNEWLEEETEDAGSSGSSQVASEDTIPLEIIEIPKNIDFVMNVSMKKILYDNMTINNLNGVIRVKDQVAIMSGLKMNMLQGEIVVNGSYNTQNMEVPNFDFDLKIKECDIQESFYTFNTVQSIVPMGKYTSGNYSTEMSIKGNLDDEMMPDMNSLDGRGLMLIIDAVVENFKPLVKVSQALKMNMFEKYEIKDTKVSFTIADGRMILSPFDIKDGDNKFNISGNSGFDSSIDYLIKADVPRSIIGGQANALIDNFLALGGAQAQNLIGDRIKVNINIGGTVDNPTIKTGFGDNASSAKSNLQDKAKQEFAKKKKELEDKAKQEAAKAEAKAKAEADKAKQKAKQEAIKKKKELEAKAKAEAAKRKKAAEKKAKEEAEKAKQKAAEEAKKKLKGLLKNK